MVIILPMFLLLEVGSRLSHGMFAVTGQSKSLNTDPEVAMEKVLRIQPAPPSMIFCQKAIVSPES